VKGGRGKELFQFLHHSKILGDWREPDTIRLTPAPMYNNHREIDRVEEALSQFFG
jgi:kynureninase